MHRWKSIHLCISSLPIGCLYMYSISKIYFNCAALVCYIFRCVRQISHIIVPYISCGSNVDLHTILINSVDLFEFTILIDNFAWRNWNSTKITRIWYTIYGIPFPQTLCITHRINIPYVPYTFNVFPIQPIHVVKTFVSCSDVFIQHCLISYIWYFFEYIGIHVMPRKSFSIPNLLHFVKAISVDGNAQATTRKLKIYI